MRHARWHQAEIALGIGSIVLLVALTQSPVRAMAPGWIAFFVALFLIVQPTALVRLVEHFLPVPKRVFWVVAGGGAIGLLALVVLPLPRPPAFLATTAACFGAAQGYVAWMLIQEARRSAGVTRTRLLLGGLGASTATLLVLVEGVGWMTGVRLPAPLLVGIALGLVACYMLGFAPPRRVLRAWQERQFIQLLRDTAARTPDEREDHLPDDLNEAARRGVTAAVTAVLLGRTHLTVYASSERVLQGLAVTPEVGLVGVAFNSTNPVVGSADECERPLNERIAGEFVAAIPIARSAPGWGVLLVVQRRASVYQSEDLSLLGRLCRHAADILDHSRLLHDEQRRHLGMADARRRAAELAGSAPALSHATE